MKSLSQEEKDIILDFYFRCGSQERIDKARDMIASDERAAKLYARLEDTLVQLDHVKYEPCPQNLVDLTVARLKLAASAEQASLEKLLAAEQQKSFQAQTIAATIRRSFWKNIAEVAAVAAVILVVVGVYFPATSNMRQIAWRNRCNAGLSRVGAGIAGYRNDHNSALPAVNMTAGSPWWKVGEQGEENQSNTRHIWLLVKGGYVKAEDFVCPGKEDGKPATMDIAQIQKYNDFPNRRSVNYSFMLMGNKMAKQIEKRGAKTVMLSDLNPVFEKIFNDNGLLNESDEFTRVLISRQLMEMMSTNHKNKGQNVLFGDGASKFKKDRVIFGDDIFTLKDKSIYSGREMTFDIGDIFLAP
jgi:hypothetical protein